MPAQRNQNTQFRAHQDRNSATVVRSVGEKVWLCDSNDTLLLQRMGGLDAARSRFGFSSIGSLSYEWINDHNLPNSVKITVNLGAPAPGENADAFGHNVYTTDNTVTVDHPEYLFRGMVLWIAAPSTAPANSAPEYMWVQSVSGNVATVTRGWRGTPVWAYTAVSVPILSILTIVAEECHEFVLNANVARSLSLNYWQTFVAGMTKSKKYDYIEHYGVEDDYQRQMMRIMGGTIEGRAVTGELPRMLEQAMFYGLPSPGGSQGDSSFGGINSFPINQVVVPILTFETIQDALQKALMDGADINQLTIITSPALQRMMSGWTDGTVNRDRGDTAVGTRIKSVVSDWGDVEITWHRLLRQNELYILNINEMGLLQLWEFQETRLGQSTSLCEDTMIDGCYGFALACPIHHTRIRVDSTCVPSTIPQPAAVDGQPTYVPVPEPGVPVVP